MTKKLLALVYDGPGACEGCPEVTARFLQNMGYETRYVKPGEITAQNLASAQLYVQPAGTDMLCDQLDVLTSHEICNVQNFVAEGGKYLGICYGGYLAGIYADEERPLPAFNLIPSVVQEVDDNYEARLEVIEWQGQDHLMYFQGGPQFNVDEIPGAEVWGKYKSNGQAAALIAPYKKGFVGLIGPHPEAENEWYEMDGLEIPDPIHRKLGADFVRALVGKNVFN